MYFFVTSRVPITLSYWCCIPKTMVGLERRMRSTLTEREALDALEHLRIEIQVHSNSRLCVNIFLIY